MKPREILKRARELRGRRVVVEATYRGPNYTTGDGVSPVRIFEGVLVEVDEGPRTFRGRALPLILGRSLAGLRVGPGTMAVGGQLPIGRSFGTYLDGDLVTSIREPADYDLRRIINETL